MRARYLLATLLLAFLALAAGAVPAFTSDSGTVSVNITARSPAEPCIELLGLPGALVDFGTLAFSSLNQPSSGPGDIVPRFRNCGTDGAKVLVHGGNATGPSATWTIDRNGPYSCDASSPRNAFQLGATADQSPALLLDTTPATLLSSAGPGTEHTLALFLVMPCAGSDGAGQTLTTPVQLTAESL